MDDEEQGDLPQPYAGHRHDGAYLAFDVAYDGQALGSAWKDEGARSMTPWRYNLAGLRGEAGSRAQLFEVARAAWEAKARI